MPHCVEAVNEVNTVFKADVKCKTNRGTIQCKTKFFTVRLSAMSIAETLDGYSMCVHV